MQNVKYRSIKRVIDAIGGVEALAVLLTVHSSSRDGKDESKINKDVVENIEKSTRCFL